MPTIHTGNAKDILVGLDEESVHCCVTSPPYWGLRDYGVPGQLGLEPTPEEYVARIVEIFREVRRVLRDDGTVWVNLGDSYSGGASGQNFLDPNGSRPGGGRVQVAGGFGHIKTKRKPSDIGLKPKDMVGIPWRVAFALQADGWYLRSDIIWHKPNPMPESVTDRPTKAHEFLFLLSKSPWYYYNHEAIQEDASEPDRIRNDRIGGANGHKVRHSPGGMMGKRTKRNKRDVWTVETQPYPEAHFATFPEDLVRPCILAGCPLGGTVLDPFCGSGTTLLVAQELQCDGIGIELNPEYVTLAEKRISQSVLALS